MVTTSMWIVMWKCEEDKNFAPKQNERDCPMTSEYIFKSYFGVTCVQA